VIEHTHIRVSKETKSRLNEWRGTGQSYDGAIKDLLGLAYVKGVTRNSPLSPGLSEGPLLHSTDEARTPSELVVETERGAMRIKNISPPSQTHK